ncbi:hypothetical protein [Maricaulis sp.]|uniref:hypothetical protein n=1 Tax=Maricaulis sp. TaxID=1486257 RepID=UPI0026202E07|nr:hypothetical protein [Maricaulis sp.]
MASKATLKTSIAVIAAVGVLESATPSALGYGGEDVRHGRPWHHLDITLRALAGDAAADADVIMPIFDGAGFSRGAAMSVAWHADYIDSYLYNPLWWAQGGLDSARMEAALAMHDDLVRMHHDDTFTTAGIADNFERYFAGALAGLYWAAEQGEAGDVAAAHQIIGIASHALQDFYSHSNWIDDPERRARTWFEVPPAERGELDLYSGAYELTEAGAPAHHGAYSLSCSAANTSGVEDTLSALCGTYSPLQSSSMCVTHRVCDDSVAVNISVSDVVAEDTVYLHPTGIAMDTTWLARIGGEERRLLDGAGHFRAASAERVFTDAQCNAIVNYGVSCEHAGASETCVADTERRTCTTDADFLFAQGKYLATRSTEQFMYFLERAMAQIDPDDGDRYEAFWDRVKNETSSMSQRTAQFEDFSRIPFQFMSAGEYPVRNPSVGGEDTIDTSHGWYLRTRIRTSNDRLSGTDADIRLRVEGQGWSRTELLDYLPTSDAGGRTDNRLLVYNDFERGENDVYTVGPFPGRPQRVSLINDSASAGDVAEALWDDFVDGVDHAMTGIRRVAIGLIGGNADFVGQRSAFYTLETFDRTFGGADRFSRSMTVDGGPEGRYRLYYDAERVDGTLSAQERADGWTAIRFTLTQLRCLRESAVDRGSNSDEPFVFVTISPLNGRSGEQSWGFRDGPFSDVDSGERRNLRGQRSVTVELPPGGGVAMAMQVWENDSENAYDRRELWRTFRTGIDEETRRGNSRFLDEVGRATAEDWRVAELEVTPFWRGERPQVAPTGHWRGVGWIDGGERRSFNLPAGASRWVIPLDRPSVADWMYVDIDPGVLDMLREATRSPRLPDGATIRRVPIPSDVDPAGTSPDVTRPDLGDRLRRREPAVLQTPRLAAPVLSVVPPWQGTWSTNFGELRLVQDGETVRGTYVDDGTLEGRFDPQSGLLAGSFTNNERTGRFEFDLSGETFSGRWRWPSDAAWREGWRGERADSARPDIDGN